MNSPVGMGGVLLVIAAVVWLMVFVPGWAKRGEIVAAAKNANAQLKAERELEQSSPQFRLNRLVATQRIFSILFLLLLIAGVTTGLLAGGNSGSWILSITLSAFSVLSLFVARAAAKQADRVAHNIYSARQQVRSSASKAIKKAVNTKEWTPISIPDPLSKKHSESAPDVAEVIDISKPRRMMTSKEIDEILARRRAI
jgi:uncharacterized membrane protein